MRQQRRKKFIPKTIRAGFFWGTVLFLVIHYRRILNLILAFPLGEMGGYLLRGDTEQAVLSFGGYIHDLVSSGLFWRWVYFVLTLILLIWLLLFTLKQHRKERNELDIDVSDRKIQIPPLPKLPKLAAIQKYVPKLPALPKQENIVLENAGSQRFSDRARVKTKLVLGNAHYVSFEALQTGKRLEFEVPKSLFEAWEEQAVGVLSYTEVFHEKSPVYVFEGFEQEKPPAEVETVTDDRIKELRTYKKLLDEGLITEADYEAKKRQIIEL